MSNLIREFSNFMPERDFRFEEEIIDPILTTIREHQEYLTKRENLPQLAKLGYMFNTLWYAGRVCWGYNGILRKKYGLKQTDDDGYEIGDCEDNPKYKIEMCHPNTTEREDLIYDAWGMHVENEIDGISFNDFKNLILNGKELSDFEKAMIKPNKTIDEWVEILTDKRYPYYSIYKDRRNAISFLMCVTGSGYGLNKDGFLMKEAGGADQDSDIYGDWKNAKLAPAIASNITSILDIPELKETLDVTKIKIDSILNQKRAKEKERNASFYKTLKRHNLYSDNEGDIDWNEISLRLDKIKGDLLGGDDNSNKYIPFPGINDHSIIFIINDDESLKRLGLTKIDPSLIRTSIEIAKEIVEHEDKESENNVLIAKEILARHGFEKYQAYKKEVIDWDRILDEISDAFANTIDSHKQVHQLSNSINGDNYYYLHLNDKRKNEYGDNNCILIIGFKKDRNLPIGLSNNLSFLRGTNIYDDLQSSFNKIAKISRVLKTRFYYSYLGSDDSPTISIYLTLNPKSLIYTNQKVDMDNWLIKMGFHISATKISIDLDKRGITLITEKPDGSYKEPNSKVKNLIGLDRRSRNKVFEFQIDERGYNTLSYINSSKFDTKLAEWIKEEFHIMKDSDGDYGTYGKEAVVNPESKNEGKKKLYTHDFMIWLYNHQ